ncbi:MAG TPA: crossover junction endodeoxyribonuclease RuvC [Patescibacteria group bacterium]|nr:crossover junction endodeoxyribonuclease RuvC [Patescibacteria group bacterium]
MRILGIDPGTASTGYGIIDVPEDILGRELGDYGIELVDYGFISTPKDIPMEKRLVQLYSEMQLVVEKFSPEQIAIEMLFFGANTKTAIAVGQARGIVMLAAGMADISIFEYAGPQVKLMVTGAGRADKKQVHEGVRNFVSKMKGEKAAELSKPMMGTKRKKSWDDNAVDAVAIAICHVLKKLVSK